MSRNRNKSRKSTQVLELSEVTPVQPSTIQTQVIDLKYTKPVKTVKPPVSDSKADDVKQATDVPAPTKTRVTASLSRKEGVLRDELLEKVDKLTDVKDLKGWSTPALQTFLETRAHPARTLRGNLVVDVRRGDPRKLSATEVEDFVDGHLKYVGDVDVQEVWNEIARRYRIPGNWTHEDMVTRIKTGQRPAVSPGGYLINDAQRNAKTLDQYTYPELRAALIGDVPCTFPQEAVVAAVCDRLEITHRQSTSRLISRLENDRKELNMEASLVKSKLEEYKSLLTVKNAQRLTEKTAGDAQTVLFKLFTRVKGLPYREFHEAWTIILDFINEHYTTLFAPDLRSRGWGHLNATGSAVVEFEDLLTLAIHTRKAATRIRDAAHYNFNTVLRNTPNETHRQNFRTFYRQ